MRLRSTVRHCLYLNWALPRDAAPSLQSPLRYETHRLDGEDYVFVSALLFRQHRSHLEAVPVPRLSFPQLNLRLYVYDDELPAVYFLHMFVPRWASLPLSVRRRHDALPGRSS